MKELSLVGDADRLEFQTGPLMVGRPQKGLGVGGAEGSSQMTVIPSLVGVRFIHFCAPQSTNTYFFFWRVLVKFQALEISQQRKSQNALSLRGWDADVLSAGGHKVWLGREGGGGLSSRWGLCSDEGRGLLISKSRASETAAVLS